MYHIDNILSKAYWNLRALSVVEFPRFIEMQYSVLIQDTYTLLSNIETFYTYDAHGFFADELDKKMYVKNYIEPLYFTFKVMDKIDLSKFATKPIRKFCAMYSVVLPSLKNFGIQCEKVGLPKPVDFNYSCSRKWLDYEGSVKELGRKITMTDWRWQNE